MIIFAKIIKSIIYKDFILLNVHPALFVISHSAWHDTAEDTRAARRHPPALFV